GCSSVFGIIFLFPFLLVMGIMYGIFDNGDLDAFFKIERSTVQREALPADKCQAVDKWYQDDWGDWIDESGEEASLKAGLQHFYEKTGVQPYLWIMGEEGKDYMSEGSVEELAEEKYKELFGNDEGHLLVIFREYPNESSNYIVTATPGHDAETQVMDEQAREILLDYIDYFYTDNDLNEGRFFQRAFSRAADRIMIKQLSTKQLATIVIVAVVVVIGIIVTASIIRKKKVAIAKQKALQKQAEAQQAKAVAAQKQTEFNQQKYNDELETQYVAVECPNCGSTGNKIRRTTVGYCPFCGTAIKVDENGNVTFVNRNEPAT
ncbi:MAG: hypothetical protein K6D93_03750, partial [Saccharofermentans sp.]|nr:hypothetical protein [Saccharofermentans sp.]